MNYKIGRHNRSQIPLLISKISDGRRKIGREKYGWNSRGFEVDLAIRMREAGLKAGRNYFRKTGRAPYSIRVYNLQSHLEVEID